MNLQTRSLLAGSILVFSLGLLTSCVPEPVADSSVSTSDQTADQKKSSTGSTKPSESSSGKSDAPTGGLKSETIGTTCETVFPLDRLYEFDANLALVPEKRDVSSPVVEQQNNIGGLFCSLMHLSTGETVQFGFVRLTSDSADVQQKAISSRPASELFQVSASITGQFSAPTAQFIAGKYWVSVTSPTFAAPVDASIWSNLAIQGLSR